MSGTLSAELSRFPQETPPWEARRRSPVRVKSRMKPDGPVTGCSTAVHRAQQKGNPMGMKDKAENTAENLKGKAKEHTGRQTGDRDLEAEGQVDQSKSDLKQAGEKVKDAFKN